MPLDRDFVDGFLKGDPEVLHTIYTRSFPMVLRYIRSHDGTRKDAEDIFHNALLNIFVKLKQQNIQIQSFENYLFTVCRNAWRREATKNRVTNPDVIPLVGEDADRASFYVEQEQYDLFQEKFKALSQQCRDILKMVFNKNTYAEIVNHFGYSSQTVARQRVFKCKARLVQLIKKDPRYRRLKN